MLLSCFLFNVFTGLMAQKKLVQPIVHIKGQGAVAGMEVSLSRTQKASIFLGIPFASPPIGDLRFKAPVIDPFPTWMGVKNATEYPPTCMQVPEKFIAHDVLGLAARTLGVNQLQYDEDCLYINLYVPSGPLPRGTDGWPVVVWFHPGDFKVGSPNLWDGSIFAIKQKVIVAVPAYRLNILGFFTTGDSEAEGNYGLKDQIAALTWIERSIQYFNGSSTQITLMGHGAGSTSISILSIISSLKDKFQRIILMSGNFLMPNMIQRLDNRALDVLADYFYCDKTPSKSLVNCLRNFKFDTLVKKSIEINNWGPVIDYGFSNITDPFFPDEPEKLLHSGMASTIMLGYTDMEEAASVSGQVSKDKFENIVRQTIEETKNIQESDNNDSCPLNEDLLADSILFYYNPSITLKNTDEYGKQLVQFSTDMKISASMFRFAEIVSSQVKTFFYRFDYKLKTLGLGDNRDWVGVTSQLELPLVWGMPFWIKLEKQVSWNINDKKQSDVIMNIFGDFIKTGTPIQNKRGLSWDVFSSEQPYFFIIGNTNMGMSTLENIDYKAFTFWNDYYPKIYAVASICCNSTETGTNLIPQPILLFLPIITWVLINLMYLTEIL